MDTTDANNVLHLLIILMDFFVKVIINVAENKNICSAAIRSKTDSVSRDRRCSFRNPSF